MKVLHYKSNFLNTSETFIKRLIENQRNVETAAMCVEKRALIPQSCPVFEQPRKGLAGLINRLCFHLNWNLPFYNQTIRSFKPDLIHAHFGFDGYRMIKPSCKAGIPLIVSFYGSDVSRLPDEFDWGRRYQKLARRGAVFIAASQLMKEQLIDLGFPQTRIEVVRFGLDLSTFPFIENRQSRQNIMMVGRMVEKKGFIFALQAIKLLKDQGSPVHLDVYGDGELREKLQNKAREWGINHLVHFYGQQPMEKIREAHQNHSLLLVPSITASDGDREGIPNTLLEGMASGIPVVATRHAAIPEVITHQKNGLLVEEKNADAIADMIQATKNTALDFSSLRRNARRHIENHYNIHQMVQKVNDIYRRILTNS